MDIHVSQPQALDLEQDSVSGFRLQVVIQRFDEPIVGKTLVVQDELLIGRSETAGLPIGGRLVSRRHAVIRAVPTGLEIEDLSANGTLVDGSTLRNGRRQVANECTLLVGCTRVWLRRLAPPAAVTAHGT